MIYLLLSILVSTVIFIVFKLIRQHKDLIFQVIVINYIIAAIISYVLLAVTGTPFFNDFHLPGMAMAFIIGILFIGMFYIVGLTTRHAGIVVTTISSKMSVIFPIILSISIDRNDRPDILTLSGIGLTLIAVFLTIYKKRPTGKTGFQYFYLPLVLFFGMGLVDSLVKYAQYNFITDDNTISFTAFLFTISAIIGIFISIIRKISIQVLIRKKVVLAGIALGLANLGSVYFLVKTLNLNKEINIFLESSSIFALNNMGIVIASVITGFLFFKEKISILNAIGIVTSLFAIYLLTQ
jgi:drug/metabolite transporter (DMT)-like permease